MMTSFAGVCNNYEFFFCYRFLISLQCTKRHLFDAITYWRSHKFYILYIFFFALFFSETTLRIYFTPTTKSRTSISAAFSHLSFFYVLQKRNRKCINVNESVSNLMDCIKWREKSEGKKGLRIEENEGILTHSSYRCFHGFFSICCRYLAYLYHFGGVFFKKIFISNNATMADFARMWK